MSEKDPKLAKPPTKEELEERLRNAVDEADAGNFQPRPERSRLSRLQGKGVEITPQPDDRIKRILADPEKYFAEERVRIRAEVLAEIAEENRRRGIKG